MASRFPVLYHMAEDGSWESIRRLGLLSTSALLDRFGVYGEERFAIESVRRPEMVAVERRGFGTALVRDNKPMQEAALERCLQGGMTPRQWYEHLNGRVFFWVSRARLRRFLCARPYRNLPHVVIELDAAKVLERYAERTTLSAINSGAVFPMNPAPRGPETFRRISDVSPKGTVVELAVDREVREVEHLASSVSRWRCDEFLEEVWRRAG